LQADSLPLYIQSQPGETARERAIATVGPGGRPVRDGGVRDYGLPGRRKRLPYRVWPVTLEG